MSEQLHGELYNRSEFLKRAAVLGLALPRLTKIFSVENAWGANKDPFKVAVGALSEMNNNSHDAHPNVIWGGAIRLRAGTFINNAPLAEAEHSRTSIPGTMRVPEGKYFDIAFPRLYRKDGITYALGFQNNKSPSPGLGSGTIVNCTKWVNLHTAKYDAYAYHDPNDSGHVVTPRLLPVRLDRNANLMLINAFPIPEDVPDPLQSMVGPLNDEWSKGQLDSWNLVPTKLKPHL